MTRQEYSETLARLEALLRRKPLTARAVARELGCSRPVAHARLAALRERLAGWYTTTVRESPTGPASTAYGLLR